MVQTSSYSSSSRVGPHLSNLALSNTAIKFLHQILQQYRLLPSSPPTPKPRRAPKLKSMNRSSTLPNSVSHKRALQTTASVLTRSMKRSRTDHTLNRHPGASSSPAPNTARSWDRLIFSVGRTTGSIRRVKRRTRSDHNEDSRQDGTHRPSLPQQHDAQPHTTVSPPALLGTHCNTTTVQAPAKRARKYTFLQNPITTTEGEVLLEFERAPDYPLDAG